MRPQAALGSEQPSTMTEREGRAHALLPQLLLSQIPVPVRVTGCGLAPGGLFTFKESEELRVPVLVGSKVTVAVQLAPGWIACVVQVLVSKKSTLSAPLR